MKKFLCILLLLICLPVCVMAETPAEDLIALELQPLDMGDFTMNIFNVDGLQMGEKADGELWARIYPAYNENEPFHNTIQIVWYESDLSATVDMVGVELYGQAMLNSMVDSYASAGITATNAQLLNSISEDNQMVLLYCMDMDYTGAGVDLQLSMWQLQQYYMTPDGGTYCFTLTTDSQEDMELLILYLGTVSFVSAQ